MRLTEEQARGILELRLQRLTGLERDKIQAELTELAEQDRASCSTSSARASAPHGDDARGADRGAQASSPSPRLTESSTREADQDDESLIEPRGDGRHRHPRRLHQAHAARDLPRAESRRQGRTARRRAARTSSPRSFNAHTHHRCCSSPRAARSTGEGLAPAGGRRRTRKGRALINLLPELGERHDHHRPAAAGGRERCGRACT